MPSKSTVSPAGAGMRPTFNDDMMDDGIDDAHDLVQVWPGVSVTSTGKGTSGGWSELKLRAACRSTQHQAGTYLSLSLWPCFPRGRGVRGDGFPTTLSILQCHRSGQRLLFTFFAPPPPSQVDRHYSRYSSFSRSSKKKEFQKK